MEDRRLSLVQQAKSINSKIISLPRLLILVTIAKFKQDGVSYRELKAGLELGDGVLFANLRTLEQMGYLESKKVKLSGEEMTVYCLKKEGQEALFAAKRWLMDWLSGD
ncbi:MAG: transcriptional regulator [Candidatus Micrarchaeota archaeon]